MKMPFVPKRLGSVGALGAVLIVAGACTGMELDSARRANPTGSSFNQALYTGYLGLSESEFNEYDYSDSDGFAMKAISAAGDNHVGPADLAEWNIPDGNVGELGTARARLLNALDASGRTKAPEPAAQAQVMFDCWVQEQEENLQPEHIARCRSGFYNAITAVEVALRPKVMAAEPAPEPEPEPMAEPVSIPTNFVVFFDFNSTALTQDARWTIREAAAAAGDLNAGEVAILGHTDRAGASAYNDRLARQRAKIVAGEFIAAGGDASVVNLDSFGETKPATQTTDNVKDGRNRRVEIILK